MVADDECMRTRLAHLLRIAVSALLFASAVALAPVDPSVVDAASLPLVGIVQMDAGTSSACGVFGSGAVTCWGNGGDYGLGSGSSAHRSSPTAVVGVTTAVKVTVGSSFACALLWSGGVQCWGDNSWGQLGTGGFDHPTTAVSVAGLGTVVDIDAGLAHVCATSANGTVKCWGANTTAQLSLQPTQIGVPTPTTVANLSTVEQVAAGGNHTCARRADDTVRCWGSNNQGQLGIGSYSAFVVAPTSPTSLTGVIDISSGYGHTCVIADTAAPLNVVRCWGSNDSKQLGSNTISNVPQTITSSLGTPSDVDVQGQNSCVTNTAGGVLCWGDNTSWQLGNDSAVQSSATAVTVTGVDDATAVSVGGSGFVCAVREGQAVWCWGNGYAGLLGRGSDDDSPLAGPVITPFPEYISVTPARVLDTRPIGVTVDGQAQKSGVVVADSTLKLQLRSRGGVPANGVSVALNLTAVASAKAGWATVWPCNEAKPNASNINFLQGVTRANMVIGRITTTGADTGKICISPSVNTHLIVDVMGYYRVGSSFTALSPARLFDSRPTGQTVDGSGKGSGLLTPILTVMITVAGRGGVPAGATAAALNITSVSSGAGGSVTVWPCNIAQPITGNLSVQPGVTAANVVITDIHQGVVCFKSTANTHLIVDVVGYYSTATDLLTPPPVRYSDSRAGATTVDGLSKAYGALAAGATVKVRVVSRGSASPSVVRSAVLGISSLNAGANGFITVFPCGTPRPNASTLNMTAGVAVSATTMVAAGDDNDVCIYSSVATHLVVESFGFYYF